MGIWFLRKRFGYEKDMDFECNVGNRCFVSYFFNFVSIFSGYRMDKNFQGCNFLSVICISNHRKADRKEGKKVVLKRGGGD